MRRSGEAKAVGPEDPNKETTGEEGAAAHAEAPPARKRPYPIWLKVEPPRRRVPPLPAHASRSLWARLSRHITSCLHQRIGSAVALRGVVRAISAEMRLSGASAEEVARAIRLAVTEHPQLPMLDRTNVITRQLASEALLERMLGWLEEQNAES
jgi:hypothetical protein